MEENIEHRCEHWHAQIHTHNWNIVINMEIVVKDELYLGWAQKYRNSVSNENFLGLDISG